MIWMIKRRKSCCVVDTARRVDVVFVLLLCSLLCCRPRLEDLTATRESLIFFMPINSKSWLIFKIREFLVFFSHNAQLPCVNQHQHTHQHFCSALCCSFLAMPHLSNATSTSTWWQLVGSSLSSALSRPKRKKKKLLSTPPPSHNPPLSQESWSPFVQR